MCTAYTPETNSLFDKEIEMLLFLFSKIRSENRSHHIEESPYPDDGRDVVAETDLIMKAMNRSWSDGSKIRINVNNG